MRRTVPTFGVEGMKDRLAKIERDVANLNRTGGGGWEFGEPEVAGFGGPTEAFRATMSTPATVASATYAEPSWSLTSEPWTYRTPGVALSNSDKDVDLSAGIWILSAQLNAFTSSAASSGRLLAGLFNRADDFDGVGEVKAYTSWPTSVSANIHVSHHLCLPSGGSFTTYYSNELDVSVNVSGQFAGVRIADADGVTFGS